MSDNTWDFCKILYLLYQVYLWTKISIKYHTSDAGLTVNVPKVTRFIHLLFQRKEKEATFFIYNRCLNTQVRKDGERVHIQRKQ